MRLLSSDFVKKTAWPNKRCVLNNEVHLITQYSIHLTIVSQSLAILSLYIAGEYGLNFTIVPGCMFDTKSQMNVFICILNVRNTISPSLCQLIVLEFFLYKSLSFLKQKLSSNKKKRSNILSCHCPCPRLISS